MKSKFMLLLIFAMAVGLLTGCGEESDKWGADIQYGCYRMNEDDEYPYVSVSYAEGADDFGDPYIYNWILVYVDNTYTVEGVDVGKDENGAYHLVRRDYDYFIYFDGNGKIKIEMEKSQNQTAAAGLLKNTYKKAVGIYDSFEPYDKSINESLEEAVEGLDN